MTSPCKFLTLSSLFFLLSACGSHSAPPKVAGPELAPNKIPEAFRMTELRRDKARFGERQERGFAVRLYDLRGEFDWETKQLLATVDFYFRLACACQDSIVLDSEVSEIQAITLKSTGQSLAYSQGVGKELTIDLSTIPEEIRKKELGISIRYVTHANTKKNGDTASLMAVNGMQGDPISSRVVYSFSEPQGASQWMPCVNDPSFRSQFAVEFKMPADETLIANGDLVRNEVIGSERWMKYQTKYTLPNYLMAFALGELTVATTNHGKLPVSIVARKGLPVDYEGLLKETVRQIGTYEKLLVPFPFEKYMVVLLPEFSSGGVEHAGITFNRETLSSDSHLSRDLGLMAHELGHQWFGDLVTVSTWDDLWIKEGMATLLAEESSRIYMDQNGSRRLFGREFEVKEGDAIQDTALKPDDKYTSGPYGRSAWLLTQIRSVVGEQVFWATLRKVLTDYKFGSIGTDAFLEYFKSLTSEAFIASCKKALHAKELPEFEVKEANGVFDLKLDDKESALVVPIEIRWYSDTGGYEAELFTHGVQKQHLLNDKRLLVIDFQDRHPFTSMVEKREGFEKFLQPLILPKNEIQKSSLLKMGAHHQLNAISLTHLWDLKAEDFSKNYGEMASEEGKFEMIRMGCSVAKKQKEAGGKIEGWQKVLDLEVSRMPHLGMTTTTGSVALSSCQGIVSDWHYIGLWNSIEVDPSDVSRPEVQVYFASLFPSNALDAFRRWTSLANEGPSVRSRAKALANLVRQLEGTGAFTKPSEAELPQWKEYFKETLLKAEASEIVEEAIDAEKILKDTTVLPRLAQLVLTENFNVWKPAYCAGYKIAAGNEAAKKAFEKALGDQAKIPAWVKACH